MKVITHPHQINPEIENVLLWAFWDSQKDDDFLPRSNGGLDSFQGQE